MNTTANIAVSVYLDAVGWFAPSMPNWQTAQTLLRNPTDAPLDTLPAPAPTVLPPAERRRVGTGVKLALAAGLDALQYFLRIQPDADADAQTQVQTSIAAGSGFQTVFTSSGGDGDNCHALCEALAEPDRAISPTRFTNSVHNAPSGYWGIALRAKPASTSICAFDGSFGAGFLDATTQVHVQHTSVLLVSYDTPYPHPLCAVRPIQGNVGVALLLSPQRSRRSVAQFNVSLSPAPVHTLSNAVLESLRCNNPSARALPLLAQLAQTRNGVVVLDYLPDCNLAIDVNILVSNI
jgi:Beta-ketoacyl synthase, N-terminal domain